MQEAILKVLDKVRPFLVRDGGGIELVEVNEATGVVKVKFQGACHGCPMSSLTFKMAIESELCGKVPGVREVELVA